MPAPEGIRALDVILTAGCNLTCSYCYQNDKKFKKMDWETLRASLDLLLRSRRRSVRLGFYGGEPLLEFSMIRRAVEYIDATRSKSKSVRYVVITNGTLLDDEKADFLALHRFETRLSFDGIPAAQDMRGRGTFKVLDVLLERLRLQHPRYFREDLSITITVPVPAIPHFADSVEYFLSKGVHDIAIAPVETHASLWRTEMIEDLDQQFDRVFRRCLSHYRLTGEVPLQTFRKAQPDSPHRPRGMSMCGVGGGETLTVDVDGKAYGCATFAESFQTFPSPFLKSRLEKMRLGDFREESTFRRQLALYPGATREAEIFDAKQDKHSSYGNCRDCRFLTSCAICPVSIGYIPGNTDPNRVPDHLCAFNLVSLKYREKFPKQANALDIVTGRARVPRLTRELERVARTIRQERGRRGSSRPSAPPHKETSDESVSKVADRL